MKLSLFLYSFVLFNLLYPSTNLQAQIQTKTFSFNKKEKNEAEKEPSLFVRKDKKEEQEVNSEQDKQSHEIDRVFEKYKTLSAQQDKTAQEKPLKNKTVERKTSQEPEPPKSRTGFSGILEQYQQSKQNRSKTRSMTFEQPRSFNE